MNPTRPRRWRRRLLAAALLGVLLWCVASWLVADRLTRRASPLRPTPTPTLAWGTPQDVRLTTSDGEQLGAWFFTGQSDRRAVLLLHGNGGSREDCLDQAEWLTVAGHPVLLITHRAHGDSTGERNDFGYSARHDVIAAVEWLEQNGRQRPVIWGRSLGSAAALFASENLGERVAGYLLECPYQDLRTAVRNRTRSRLPQPFDWLAYRGLALTAPIVIADADRISPLLAASGIPKQTPVLILAGGNDRSATSAEAYAIGDKIGPLAEVVVFENAGHLGLSRAEPKRYREVGLRFLAVCNR